MLTTLHRFNPMLGIRTRAYWSSKGSRDEQSAEWLLLSLVHPLCLVRSVAIRPFRATFQRVRSLCRSCPSCEVGLYIHYKYVWRLSVARWMRRSEKVLAYICSDAVW